MELTDKLKEYRHNKCKEKGIPSYCIYSNSVIECLCYDPPHSLEELLSIKGIGKQKAQEYGQDIIAMCDGHSPPEPETVEPEEVVKLVPNELPTDTELSDEQQRVITLCDQGSNVFMSGPGGSGKSFLIQLLVNRYKNQKKIQVCALTGVAAELLGCDAKTIHSWSGTGISKGTSDKIIASVVRRKKHIIIWKKIDILIVDEVSMMSKEYYEILDSIGKKIRCSEEPLGGIQLLFSGDFHQLPPIGSKEPDSNKFCFESPLWESAFQNVVVLQQIFRQTDPVFTKILRQIRNGQISRKSYNLLNQRILRKGNKLSYDKEMKPTIISPLRRIVSFVNDEHMNKINSKVITFTAKIIKTKEYSQSPGTNETSEMKQLEKRMNAEQTLQLKQGSRVMCVANIDMNGTRQIVNGSQGIVEDFSGGLPVVRFKNGLKKVMQYHPWMSDEIPGFGIQQIPLILSWAITIHKSQGITLDSAIIDAGDNIFEYGQSYVALSRVKSLDGLFLQQFNHRKIMTNPKVTEYYGSIIPV